MAVKISPQDIDKRRKEAEKRRKDAQKEADRWAEELKRYDWLESEFFRERAAKASPKEIAEEILKESSSPMTPKDIAKEMRRRGYEGNPAHINPKLQKWLQSPNTKIKKTGRGFYAYDSHQPDEH